MTGEKDMRSARNPLIYGLFMIIGVLLTNPSFAKENQENSLQVDDVQRFTTAINDIKNYYVKPVDDNTLFEHAIQGMLEGLDPHSSYLDINDYADLHDTTQGEFGGLGIEVGLEDGYIRVISPIDDTPAQRAGIQPGDLIVRLGQKPVKGMSLKDAVNMMRGKKGTSVELTIVRRSEDRILKVSVVRDVIKIQSVKSKMLEPHYAYLRISQFQSPTGNSLIQAVNDLKKEDNNQLQGVVLDLRNNPGGLLDSAIEVSDAFLDSKKLGKNDLIVYTKGRIPGTDLIAKASPGDILNGLPMVVLINDGSASGSEIVAGALQDHKRAVLMGTTTFGKGSVQTVLPLDEKHGIKLTTALYYTPSGRSIQATGIKPDIVVEDMKIKVDKKTDDIVVALLKESDLDNHLKNTQHPEKKDKAQNTDKTQSTDKKDEDKPLAEQDYQLYEALNLLKGLHVAKIF